MKSKYVLPVLVLLAVVLFWTAPAQASNEDACFTFDCSGSVCDFDASCSSASPYIWKYSFDFGDGTGTGLTGTAAHTHEYDPICYPYVELSVYTFDGSDTVGCYVHTGYPGCPGPAQPQSGTCD